MRFVAGVALAVLAVACSSESTNVSGSGGSAGSGGATTGGAGGTAGSPAGGGSAGTGGLGGAGGTATGGSAGQGSCDTLVHDIFGTTSLDTAWTDPSGTLEVGSGVVHMDPSSTSLEAYQTIPALGQYSSVVLTAKVKTLNAGDVVSVLLGDVGAADTMSCALDSTSAPLIRLQQGPNVLYEWKSAALGVAYIFELTYSQTNAKLRILDHKGVELNSQSMTTQPSSATKLTMRFERTGGFGPTVDEIELLGCKK